MNPKIIVIVCLVALVAFIFVPIHYNNIRSNTVYGCHVNCWVVVPGEKYPAQFNDKASGQIVNMDCTILTKNVNGNIMASCLEH